MLQKTQLGWIVGGRMHYQKTSPSRTCNLSINHELNEVLTKFWNIECVNNVAPFTPEENYCIEHYTKSTIRDENGRFIVSMPIKNKKLLQLGESKDTALKRFLSLESKLHKHPLLKEQYAQSFTEYLRAGYMVRVDKQRAHDISRYYIPHHAVFKDTSITTKVRVVFDASCKTSSGLSLNDCLMVGPNLQQDLLSC